MTTLSIQEEEEEEATQATVVSEEEEDEDSSLNESTRRLLQFLIKTINRDGGGSLVTSLKDHYWVGSNKKLNHLLVESPIGKPRLLKFLEYFDDIFDVDRQATPHWVVLKQQIPVLLQSTLEEEDEKEDASKRQKVLLEKVEYTLRKRHARLKRRHNNSQENHPLSHQVNVRWLVRQCTWELHFYLRAVDYYRKVLYRHKTPRDVVPPKTTRWEEMVSEPLLDLLLLLPNESSSSLFDGDPITGKVWLKEYQDEHYGEGINTTQPQPVPASMEKGENEEWLDQLELLLTNLIIQDGATTVILGLLLHRHEQLKQLLGGRDLVEILQQNPNRFEGIEYHSLKSDLVLKLKPQTTTDTTKEDKRMIVDTVGLFSVTNAKWSKAMANIMIQLCKQQGFDLQQTTAVDLTASVGGMTLGLAANKQNAFSKIIAIEIDKTRAQLCQQNMKRYGYYKEDDNNTGRVQIYNVDAYQVLPTFLAPLSNCCIVIDPPWGGEHYKQKYKNQPPLNMGPWTLAQVLHRIATSINNNNDTCNCNCKCIVGMRLPVTLDVDTFLSGLRSGSEGTAASSSETVSSSSAALILPALRFNTLHIRKLSVQILVVIQFVHGNDDDDE